MLKKNDKDECALIDQDGNENRGKTMISQTCMMELDVSDRVQVNFKLKIFLIIIHSFSCQVYAVTGTGFTDGKNSHYTQFCGVLLRASAETFKNASKMMDEEDISVGGDFRGFTPVRGLTPGPNGDISRRNSKKERRFNGNGGGNMDKAMSPQRQVEKAMSPRPTERALSPRPEVPVIHEAPEDRLQKDTTESQVDESISKPANVEAKEQQQPQSYLALTKLGGPEKKPEVKQTPSTPSQGIKKEVKRNQQQEATSSSGGYFTFLKGR